MTPLPVHPTPNACTVFARTPGGPQGWPGPPLLSPPLAALPSWPQSVSRTSQGALFPSSLCTVSLGPGTGFFASFISLRRLPRKPFLQHSQSRVCAPLQPFQLRSPALSQFYEGTLLEHLLLSLPSLTRKHMLCFPATQHHAWPVLGIQPSG